MPTANSKAGKEDPYVTRMDLKTYKFDTKYLADIPKLVVPRATMVRHGYCWICEKYDHVNTRDTVDNKSDSILTETGIRIEGYWHVIRHCKDNADCIKAVQASLAVWCAVNAKCIPFSSRATINAHIDHPISKLELNVFRSSGSVDSKWMATAFLIHTRNIEPNFTTLKKLIKLDNTSTIGLSLEKDGLIKTMPMWTMFYLNPTVKPSDVEPKWPEYFPKDIKEHCVGQLVEAYTTAQKLLTCKS